MMTGEILGRSVRKADNYRIRSSKDRGDEIPYHVLPGGDLICALRVDRSGERFFGGQGVTVELMFCGVRMCHCKRKSPISTIAQGCTNQVKAIFQ